MASLSKTEIQIEGKALYVNGSKVKIGSRGRQIEAALFFASYSKGESRQMRKALRAAGFEHVAAIPRQS
jgi:hypothetical protein